MYQGTANNYRSVAFLLLRSYSNINLYTFEAISGQQKFVYIPTQFLLNFYRHWLFPFSLHFLCWVLLQNVFSCHPTGAQSNLEPVETMITQSAVICDEPKTDYLLLPPKLVVGIFLAARVFFHSSILVSYFLALCSTGCIQTIVMMAAVKLFLVEKQLMKVYDAVSYRGNKGGINLISHCTIHHHLSVTQHGSGLVSWAVRCSVY